ncbi:hypothetical protein D3C72_1661590 [compost metagenome]
MTSTGQLYLDAYAEKIQRPIVTIETPARAFLSFEQQAESQLRALHEYGVIQFDVTGASVGAIAASELAAQAQADALNLVTVSIPNTRSSAVAYARRVPFQFVDGLQESLAVLRRGEFRQVIGPGASNLFNARKIPELIHTTKEIFNTKLDDMPSMLAASTHWTDIVGARDRMTDFKDHMRVVRARNEIHPGSSTSLLVADQGHTWVTRRRYLAALIGTILDEK